MAIESATVRTSTRDLTIRVGDVLSGREGDHVATIEIMYLGRRSDWEPIIIARELPGKHEATWTLSCRDWRLEGGEKR